MWRRSDAVVDEEAAGEVEEQRALAHQRELLLAEHVGVARPAVDVQGHDVGRRQQLVEACRSRRALPSASLSAVSKNETDMPSDSASTESWAPMLPYPTMPSRRPRISCAPGGRLVPDPGVQVGALVGQPPGERDDLGDRQLDHAAGVGERRVEDRDPALRGGGEIDLVGADAERADRQQVGCGVERGRGDLGLRADPEQVDAGSRSASSAGSSAPATARRCMPAASSRSRRRGGRSRAAARARPAGRVGELTEIL